MKPVSHPSAVCANPKCGHPLAKHHPGCTVIVSQREGRVIYCYCNRFAVEKAKEAA